MSGWSFVVAYAITTLKNLLVLGCCAYAVFWLGYSGWWFLLAICLVSWWEKDEDSKGA